MTLHYNALLLSQTAGRSYYEVLMTEEENLLDCFAKVRMFVSSGIMLDGAELIGVVECFPDGKPTDSTIEVYRDKFGNYFGRVLDIDI